MTVIPTIACMLHSAITCVLHKRNTHLISISFILREITRNWMSIITLERGPECCICDVIAGAIVGVNTALPFFP